MQIIFGGYTLKERSLQEWFAKGQSENLESAQGL